MADIGKTIDSLLDLKERLKLQKDIQGYGIYLDDINDAVELLKEQKETIEKLNGFINGFSKNAVVPVHCKDCRYGHHMVETVNGVMTTYCIFCTKPYIERGNATHEPDWYCADGRKRTD